MGYVTGSISITCSSKKELNNIKDKLINAGYMDAFISKNTILAELDEHPGDPDDVAQDIAKMEDAPAFKLLVYSRYSNDGSSRYTEYNIAGGNYELLDDYYEND